MGLLSKPMTMGMASGMESAESTSSIGDRGKKRKKPKQSKLARRNTTSYRDKCYNPNH